MRCLRQALRRYPLGAAGAVVLALLVLLAVAPGLVAPDDPAAQAPAEALRPVSRAHRFGTDNFGRDVFSRVVYGTRSSVVVVVGAVTVGLGIAMVLGAVSAAAGGWVDVLVQRAVDALMAIPWLVLAMSVMALVGPGQGNTLLVIGVLTAPGQARVLRSAWLRLSAAPFIEAARAVGCSPVRMLWRYLLPGIVNELVVLASIGVGGALLSEASLSFLGFGVAPPEPAWGYMLGVEGRRFLTTAPWLALFPGVAIALAVFAATMVGDALRDVLDPRQ
jgi:peptide/nickel transport system permease protein